MRDFLLRLFGAHRPIVIEFDQAVVDAASAGSLVILHTSRPLRGDARRYTQESFASLREKHPHLRFLLLDADFHAIVVPPASVATTLKSGRQQ